MVRPSLQQIAWIVAASYDDELEALCKQKIAELQDAPTKM
jgi:hypothetical protein